MNGFVSLHPDQKRRLQLLGVEDWMVTQGWGYVEASQGSHEPVGEYQGVRFGYCIDLTHSLANRDNIDRFEAAGFAPFVREGQSWAGNEHIHMVDVSALPWDKGGTAPRPWLPEGQIGDFILGKDGLKHHDLIPIKGAPPTPRRPSSKLCAPRAPASWR